MVQEPHLETHRARCTEILGSSDVEWFLSCAAAPVAALLSMSPSECSEGLANPEGPRASAVIEFPFSKSKRITDKKMTSSFEAQYSHEEPESRAAGNSGD